MKKHSHIIIGLLILLVIGVATVILFNVRSYLALDRSDTLEAGQPVVVSEVPIEDISDSEQEVVSYRVEEFVSDLSVPWSMVFTSPERMIVSEREGNIRQIVNGQLKEEPLLIFPEVVSKGEQGLMGIALDPNYAQNKLMYTSFSYLEGSKYLVKVVQLKDEETRLVLQKTLIDNIPAAQVHAGSRIAFGPDKKMYITTGDATDKDGAQDINFLGGKILRMNADGSVPSDNPYAGSYVFSSGHRNPQGIDWHPLSGQLFETEHGPTIFDGPAGGDEVNRIYPGGNYGWPIVSHEKTQEGMVDPLLVFTPAVAPASGMFYDGDVFPQFTNNFFFGALKGEGIVRVIVSDRQPHQVVQYEKLNIGDLGRIRDIVQGPDGLIYFSTSNRDGRGEPRDNDDKIYRIIPE